MISSWNDAIVASKGLNFMQVYPGVYLNATLINQPNLNFESTPTDHFFQLSINGTISMDKVNPILTKTRPV